MKFATSYGTTRRRNSIQGLLTAIFVLLLLKTQYPVSWAEAQDTGSGSPNIGSIGDYVHRQSGRSAYPISELGIEVLDGTGQLDGTSVHGATVVKVYPNGPGAQAGLMNEMHGAQSALLGAFLVGSFFFPPAVLGTIAVSQSQIGESHDTIIAVDSARVENVAQLESAVSAASNGGIIYLTVIRANARHQIQVISSYDSKAQR